MQQKFEPSRLKVVFVKRHKAFRPGERAQMRKEKVEELIGKKIVKIYEGVWPPNKKEKTKIKLNEL